MFLLWSHLELQDFGTQIKVFDHLQLNSITVWDAVSLFYIWSSSYPSNIYRISYLSSIYYFVVFKTIKLLNQLKSVSGSTVIFPWYKCLLCAWKLFLPFWSYIMIFNWVSRHIYNFFWVGLLWLFTVLCASMWIFWIVYKVLFIHINFL